MTDIRLKAYEVFEKKPMPSWGPDLKEIKFEEIYSNYNYY